MCIPAGIHCVPARRSHSNDYPIGSYPDYVAVPSSIPVVAPRRDVAQPWSTDSAPTTSLFDLAVVFFFRALVMPQSGYDGNEKRGGRLGPVVTPSDYGGAERSDSQVEASSLGTWPQEQKLEVWEAIIALEPPRPTRDLFYSSMQTRNLRFGIDSNQYLCVDIKDSRLINAR
ncbi:hypothetical protein FB451DRAFT_1187821 [Mycena latifolia]|nr:hypothetical protein FB451DRAFT_1187821 [Mycena latifolia]